MSREFKGTPGPWVAEEKDIEWIAISPEGYVQLIDVWGLGISQEQLTANARLIAAAPKMIAALLAVQELDAAQGWSTPVVDEAIKEALGE